MSELDFISTFVSAFERVPPPAGPGDDCALLPPQRASCVTTDAVFEGVHFTLRNFSLEDVGHKALAVNLSDLASMGARPSWFVCALGLPKSTPERHVRRLAEGMARLARRAGISLVGGNFSRAKELSVTITAAGEAPRRPLLRSGGRAGDALYVSGTLGDARLGLSLLAEGRTASSRAIHRQRRPEPRLRLGRLAAHHARACIDLSDGLARDLGHLCAASEVGARVELARLPTSLELRERAGKHAWKWALAGGEDYELLLAVPPRRAEDFERACSLAREPVTRVGELTRERALLFRAAGGREVAPPSGFDHFRSGR